MKTSAAQANEVVIFWAHDILYPMVCVYVWGEGGSDGGDGTRVILSECRSLTCLDTCLFTFFFLMFIVICC